MILRGLMHSLGLDLQVARQAQRLPASALHTTVHGNMCALPRAHAQRAVLSLAQAAQIWRKHAEAALRDPGLKARAAQNACYDDGTVLDGV